MSVLYSKLRLTVPSQLDGQNAIITSSGGNARTVEMSSPITDIMLAGMDRYRVQAGITDKNVSFGYGEIAKVQALARQMLKKIPYDFEDGQAVVYNNEIHILGSSISGNETKHYKFDGSNWVEVSTIPYNFYRGQAVVYNNEIHILGGGNGNSSPSLKYHYKWNGTNWSQVSTLPYEFYWGVAVIYNDKIHILSSNYYTGTPPNQTYSHATKHYAWDGTSWSSQSTLFYRGLEAGGGGAVVYNNEIHVFGGQTGHYQYHYKWSGGSSSSSWISQTALPYNFYLASAVVYNNKIHLLGGLNADTKHYTWDGSNYIELNTLPYKFRDGSAISWHSGMSNEIAILGGHDYKNYDAQWNGTDWTIGSD